MAVVRIRHGMFGAVATIGIGLAAAAGSAAADGLAVGPLESDEVCQRFCHEMVYDCALAVYSASSGTCLVWDERGWRSPDGLTVGTPTEADCTAAAAATGWDFWWDPDTGWCRQGHRDLYCEARDWAGRWATTYEDMRLEVEGEQVSGTYRLQSGRDYSIRGSVLPGDACVLVGEWDHNDGEMGPLRFEMTGTGQFSGTWTSGLPPTASSPANWTGVRYQPEAAE